MFGFTNLHGAKLRVSILGSTALAFLCFGYDQGVLGGIIENPQFQAAMHHPSADSLSTITSIYQIGCVFGCLLAACIGLRLGRRWTIITGCILVTIGGAVQAAAYNPGMMIAFRIVAGLGTGLTSSTVPPWIAEVAKSGVRGRDIAIELSIVLFGVMLAYWMDYGMAKYGGEVAWRFPVAFHKCLLMILAGCIIYDLPESPHVLVYWNRPEEALNVLARVRGTSEEDEGVLYTYNAIREVVYLEKSVDQPLWRSIFWDSSEVRNSRRVALIFILQAFQQLGGNNVIVYYQTILFRNAVNLSTETTLLLGGISSLIYWLGSIPPIWTIDRYGRRPILLWGSLLTGIATAVSTVSVAKSSGSLTWGWIGVGSIFFYNFAFAATWCTVVWVWPPEVSPVRFRHINSAVGPLAEWLFTFVTVKSTPPALESIGYKIYVFYTIMVFTGGIFVYLCIPETKGHTLEELEGLFASGKLFMRSGKKDLKTLKELEERQLGRALQPHNGVPDPEKAPIPDRQGEKQNVDERIEERSD